MANITFSSPALKKDVTVYAVAGDRKTLLSVAQEHKIPIHYECEDGECGSCAVQVTPLGAHAPKAVHLTEKEKTVLVLNGKLSKPTLNRSSSAMSPRNGVWPASTWCWTRTSWWSSEFFRNVSFVSPLRE